jgi:hypothetical protein
LVLTDLENYQKPYKLPSARLSEYKYTNSTGERVKGKLLRQKISEIKVPGSNHYLLRDEEAHFLTSAIIMDLPKEQLDTALFDISKLIEKARKLGYKEIGNTPSLLSSISRCREIYQDNNEVFNSYSDLGPLKSWLKKLEAEVVTLQAKMADEQAVNSPSMDPFDESPVLPVVAFEKSLEENKRAKGSSEIPLEDMTEDNMLDDIEKAVNKSKTGYIIEPERAKMFVNLLDRLVDTYSDATIKTFRTLNPSWHELPWNVITLELAGLPPIAILETIVNDSASYVIKDSSWMQIIELKRTQAQKLGAKQVIHEYDSQGILSTDYINKLYAEVLLKVGRTTNGK